MLAFCSVAEARAFAQSEIDDTSVIGIIVDAMVGSSCLQRGFCIGASFRGMIDSPSFIVGGG